ncbi:MAG: TAXI family TRAP transporter solute-binding subunit [Proteobacteria bacterium]|nr:TAXI family TRAP transporter solute-binding subunit [Pseudomonadota bacterium]
MPTIRTLIFASFFAVLAGPLNAQPAPGELRVLAAGQGSAFLPYAEGLVRRLSAASLGPARAVPTAGSIENLKEVDLDPGAVGTAFLATAYEAVTGTGYATGRPHANIRALLPMYETSFQVAALASSGLGTIRSLDGRRVGVGPANGPAEAFFRALAQETGISPVIVTGSPAELSEQLLGGQIDALWQGAIVPIPSLTAVADRASATVFGLSSTEVAAMLKRFPYMSPGRVAPGTYRGQTAEIASVAAWNFVVVHKDMPETRAYALVRAILGTSDPAVEIHPSAATTRAVNAPNNRAIPFHPGALRYYREIGVVLPAP